MDPATASVTSYSAARTAPAASAAAGGRRHLEDTDAGKTQTKTTGNGLPSTGRIALDPPRSTRACHARTGGDNQPGGRGAGRGNDPARRRPRRPPSAPAPVVTAAATTTPGRPEAQGLRPPPGGGGGGGWRRRLGNNGG